MKRHLLRSIRNIRALALIAALAAFSFGSALASPPDGPEGPQGKPGHGEEIRNMKIAFFTDALQLSPEQSQKFWPVYNQYWDARREVGKKRRDLYKVIRDGKAGEQQLKELLGVMDTERKVTADYIVKFRQVLPAATAAKVFVADEDFKNFLIRRATSGGQKK
ncbi:MAG: periplasmic heavy metal sensor [Rikenellaceae bacterium]|nr:periplasmic heavy metal sensor [Rikenellaceae bacterium]